MKPRISLINTNYFRFLIRVIRVISGYFFIPGVPCQSVILFFILVEQHLGIPVFVHEVLVVP